MLTSKEIDFPVGRFLSGVVVAHLIANVILFNLERFC